MLLKFTKMHGCGNDFMVLNLVSQNFKVTPQYIRKWSDRNFGIGFDQLLLVEPPQTPHADFRYRIFNGDGTEVEQCGNGARCFAIFVHDHKLTRKKLLKVETGNGVIELQLLGKNLVKANMGIPIMHPEQVPFTAIKRQNSYSLTIDDQLHDIGVVSMGNPHAVLLVDDIELAPVKSLGAKIESHPFFPKHVNVGFMQIISSSEIQLRVYERGAGETLACGSGACAAVVVGRLQGLLDPEVTVHLQGGDLNILWQGEDNSVIMTGSCSKVYEGRIYI